MKRLLSTVAFALLALPVSGAEYQLRLHPVLPGKVPVRLLPMGTLPLFQVAATAPGATVGGGAGGVTSPISGDFVATGKWTFGSAADAANSVRLGETAGAIVGEGATADGFETTLAFGDATADNTLSLTGTATGVTLAATTGSIQVKDNNVLICDDGDLTKCIAFQASGITTANTITPFSFRGTSGAPTVGFPDGAQATPAITGATANTGIYFDVSGTGRILFSTNATARALFRAPSSTAAAFSIGSDAVGFSGSIGGADDVFVLRGGAAAVLQLGQNVNGAAVAQTLKAHDGITGTDIAGANLTLAGGRGTGAGNGGNLILQTSPKLATGTSAQVLETRALVVGHQLNLTDNTATTFDIVTLGNDTFGGGTIHYCVYGADATTGNAECGSIDFNGIDVTAGAGGEVCPNPTKVGTPLVATVTSTLAVSFTATTGTDLCNLKVTADTNIATPVNLYIKWELVHGNGAAHTPQ